MPTIDPTLVPTINPGSLFDRLTTDTQLNIRWYVPIDPVSSAALNRPIGDIALRQLILAKTLDTINLRLGHQALFPFLVTPQIIDGTTIADIPASWIWDMHVSLPQKWERVRLARIRRISGLNPSSSSGTEIADYTGLIRLIFTAQERGSTTEIAVFQVDYQIESDLSYQEGKRISIPTTEPINLPSGESETVGGYITFRTLDTSDTTVQSFLDLVTPPIDTSAVNSNGLYISPITIEVRDTSAGGTGVAGDYDFVAVSHGTGLLTLSAFNPIPALDSDISTWLETFNYPFDATASLTSSNATGVIIPSGMFREFNVVAPSPDRPTGDVSGANYPVYINRIERLDAVSDNLKIYFATFNVETTSIVPIEFATMTLSRTMDAGRIVPIIPTENLFPTNVGNNNWIQGFGEGHALLSDMWSGAASEIANFFDAFLPIIDEPPQALFTEESTRMSSFGISRVPKYAPTTGQAGALRGSRAGSNDPTLTNRYVVEDDQGRGTQVDFATHAQLPTDKRENADIERFGYTGSLIHHMVNLCINASGEDHDYDVDILPRLRILFNRNPIFGDIWYDGTRFKIFNGDSWVG